MKNSEFIVRLRKAKDIALRLYPDEFCIFNACTIAFGFTPTWSKTCAFVKPNGQQTSSFWWVKDHCKSPDDIALVFDNSIADRQREISEGKP